MDFSGKAVFVTGASSGLGETIALSLAACPVRALVITGRDSSRLSAVESKCQATCASVFAIAGDMSDPAAIDRVVAFVEAKTSAKLDIFIGDHGYAVESAPPPDTDLGAFSEVMSVDFMSMVRLTNQLSRFMAEGGSIVFVSSLNSSVPSRGASAYCCAKAALTMFAKCAALDLGPRRIRVNAVAPGYIDTPFQNKFFASPREQTEKLAAIGATGPLGRIPSRQGIANAALFLVSDLASDITGIEQVVDCGFAINWAS